MLFGILIGIVIGALLFHPKGAFNHLVKGYDFQNPIVKRDDSEKSDNPNDDNK